MDGFKQNLIQLVVRLQGSLQVAQTSSQVQQFPERLDLFRHILRCKVVYALEIKIDFELSHIGILAQLVVHGERHVRLHALKNAVEIVERDLDESPFFQSRQGFYGLT